jgi:hypothetical protein
MISAFLIILLFVLCSHSHWCPSLQHPPSLHPAVSLHAHTSITTTYLAKTSSLDHFPPTNSVNLSLLQTNARNPCPKKLIIRAWDCILVLHLLLRKYA